MRITGVEDPFDAAPGADVLVVGDEVGLGAAVAVKPAGGGAAEVGGAGCELVEAENTEEIRRTAESLGWQPTAAATLAGRSAHGGFSSGKTPPLRRQQQQLVGDATDAYGLSSSKQEARSCGCQQKSGAPSGHHH
jgi:hypothetical protein